MYQPISDVYPRTGRLGTMRAVLVSALLIGCGGIEDPMTDSPDAGAQVQDPDAAPVPTPDAAPEDPDAAPNPCAEGHTGAGCLECDTGYQDEDANGVCAPACDATGDLAIDCGAHGACDVAADTGLRYCACDEAYGGDVCQFCTAGYESDGNGNCILDLPTTIGMTLWLDGNEQSSLGLLAAGEVQEWRDRRGGANPVTLTVPTVAARPSWLSTGLHGRGVVHFDGDDDLRASGFSGFASSDYTIFMVFKPTLKASESLLRLTHIEFGTSFVVDRLYSGYAWRMIHRSPPGSTGGDEVLAQLTNPLSAKLLVTRRTTGSTLKYMRLEANDGTALDGVEDLNGTLTNPNLSSLLTLRVGDGSLTGDMAEIIIYNRLLSQNEVINVREYLAAKWGLK